MSVPGPAVRFVNSAVLRAAKALRQEVLKCADGALLGSETHLVRRLKVSRPTFRQAAKLIEQEQLLIIRRGVGGGFFARKPSHSAVTHMARVFLVTRKATRADALGAASPLFGEIARAAALRINPPVRVELTAFLSSSGRLPCDLQSLQGLDRELLRILAAAAGNPVLELCATVLMSLAGSLDGSSVSTPQTQELSVRQEARGRLVTAILNADAELAHLMALRWSDSLLQRIGVDASSSKPRRAGLLRQRRSQFGSVHPRADSGRGQTAASLG
jgi:GntR family transcriptional regulator, transcriptional repressor for pyruvate dehydrogenase complex